MFENNKDLWERFHTLALSNPDCNAVKTIREFQRLYIDAQHREILKRIVELTGQPTTPPKWQPSVL